MMMSRDNFAQWLFSTAVSTTIMHAADVLLGGKPDGCCSRDDTLFLPRMVSGSSNHQIQQVTVRICECGHDRDHHVGIAPRPCRVCGCVEYSCG